MTVFEMYKQYGLSPGSSGFGPRPAFNDYHWGCDFPTPVGVTIHTHMDCILRLSGTYASEVILTMEALDGSCNWTIGHCSEAYYKAGTTVKAGTLVGKTGNTGNSTGAHAHWEYDRGRFKGSITANHNAGTTVDPLPYIKAGGHLTGGIEDMTTEEYLSDLFDIIACDPHYAESRPDVFKNHVNYVNSLDWAGRRGWAKQVMTDNGVLNRDLMASHLASDEAIRQGLEGQLQAANQANATLRANIETEARKLAAQQMEMVQDDAFKAAYRTQARQDPPRTAIDQWRKTDLSADQWVIKNVPNADIQHLQGLLDASSMSVGKLNETIEAQKSKLEELTTEVLAVQESLKAANSQLGDIGNKLKDEQLTSETLRTQLESEKQKSKPVNQLTILQLLAELFNRLTGGAKV
jgi:hypothetical protein